ncbi:alanine racemase [Reinekea marinisedimentorum]|uniref:Alanine racemase n=1 Tax=Reinekea marinisedimentorum TaxID=230495 RepID=A0A4R3I3L6_9GAMM|nr:alanine racemase [Reinekea marinisedimentorum]TCS40164.1 alanine racemase [Reinekea marinisedimentorum]
MTRGTKALISASALKNNFQRAKQLAPNSRVWAVIKADAYGHGSVAVANVLHDADGYAVATLGEARTLRAAGIKLPILLLAGVTQAAHLSEAADSQLECVLHCREQLAFLERLDSRETLKVWLKLDTGMHRLGFSPEDLQEAVSHLEQCANVDVVGIMTHMCCADDLSQPQITERQLKVIRGSQHEDKQISIANSASVIKWPQTHADWVRPGIMLYGATPFADISAREIGLAAAMTLVAPVIAIKQLAKGESVGYGMRWTAGRDSVIATLAIGYADGYPRHAPDGTPVWLNGKVVPLSGRVCMDMMMIDVTDLPDVKVGDLAELWGANLPVDEVGRYVDTIGYELVTRVSPRVEREMVE